MYNTLHSFQIPIEQATPMVRQYLDVKRNHPGIILFYRMGDFYETFFEDALITARVLEITLTGRDAGQLGKIPMAGIPVKAVDSYLGKLLNKNFKVAICEQTEDTGTPKGATPKGLMDRRVVRVLSSGTVTDQNLLKPQENNYLAALTLSRKTLEKSANAGTQNDRLCGLAFCDISTGAFFVTELTYGQLISELDRIRPTEILVSGKKVRPNPEMPTGLLDEFVPDIPAEISEPYPCTPLPAMAWQISETQPILSQLLKVSSMEGFGLEEAPLALQAAGAIGYYLKENFFNNLPVLDRIQRYFLGLTVNMNATARRNLELLETARSNQYEGSLLWLLNQTCTNMGGRMLRHWISQPLTHLPEIQSRLDSVEELVLEGQARETLRRLLPDIYDIERLSAKVAQINTSPRDLIALKNSIARLPAISECLSTMQSFHLIRMQAFPPALYQLVTLIDQAIDDAPNLSPKEGGIIKSGYHPELDRMRQVLSGHEAWLTEYEIRERERTGIKNLKVAFNQAFGYYIEITRSNLQAVPTDYHRKQTLTNAERYTTDALKAHESQLMDAQANQYELEYRLFIELREKLLPFVPVLKDCAQRVATLDVLQSLATVAVERGYVKPLVDASLEINLQQCRHPVVEKILPMGCFVPNDCVLTAAERDFHFPQMMMITGPNMAGKSTYMRQIALITIMAQMGSFVPASYARIGTVDSIFTRVGAVDDLSSGQSTFMVEMNETAHILNAATQRSLVILDEVGRGTSTFDGVSIAWSVAEYLTNHIGCRTLFATHYHELNTLEAEYPKIRNYRVCVTERDGDSTGHPEIEFLHRVEPGAAQKSYGIQVARMAGIPSEVIRKASVVLNLMQKRELAVLKGSRTETIAEEAPQLSLF